MLVVKRPVPTTGALLVWQERPGHWRPDSSATGRREARYVELVDRIRLARHTPTAAGL